jgi:hypothetical protein
MTYPTEHVGKPTPPMAADILVRLLQQQNDDLYRALVVERRSHMITTITLAFVCACLILSISVGWR